MRVVIVPPTPALLPGYASRLDPVADLRAAVTRALSWVGPCSIVADDPDPVDAARGVTTSIGHRLALAHGLSITDDPGADRVVFASGSAMRTPKAPGSFDERAETFDAEIGRALVEPDPLALGDIDLELGEHLWARGLAGLVGLAQIPVRTAYLDYDDAPYGVQYWVARWEV